MSETQTKAITSPLTFLVEQSTKNMQAGWNITKHMLGIDWAKTSQSPRDEVYSDGKATLWHYRSNQVRFGPPVLLIPSLVSRAFILDLQPGNSLVEHLVGQGLDVYMMDWGEPDEADAANTLETYTHHMLPRAVREIDRRHQGSGVTLFGYCFGGVLTLLYAASHPEDPVANLVQLATPVDFEQMPKSMRIAGSGGVDPDHVVDETGNVPAAAVRRSFSFLTPTADISTIADFFEKAHDDKFLNNYQAMTSWTRNHVPFPGAAFRQTVTMLQENNAIVNNTLVLNGTPVDLADITVPFLNILGEKDHIVPPEGSEPLAAMIGSDDKTDLRLNAGHVGMIIGSSSRKRHMPAISEWIVERSYGSGEGPKSAAAAKVAAKRKPRAKKATRPRATKTAAAAKTGVAAKNGVAKKATEKAVAKKAAPGKKAVASKKAASAKKATASTNGTAPANGAAS